MNHFLQFLQHLFITKPTNSKRGEVNWNDLHRVIRNGIIVGFSSFLLYLSENLIHVDFGLTVNLIIPFISMGLEVIYRWIRDNSDTDMDEDCHDRRRRRDDDEDRRLDDEEDEWEERRRR